MNNTKYIRSEQATIRKKILKLINKCELCGDDTKEILQVHHIIPVTAGGSNNADNLIVLCPNCHFKAHRGLISVEELQSHLNTDIIQKVINSRKRREKQNIEIEGSMIKSKQEFEYFIKGKLAENGLNVAKLAIMLNTSHQNVLQRLKRCGFDYVEISHIADLLGYDIEWKKR